MVQIHLDILKYNNQISYLHIKEWNYRKVRYYVSKQPLHLHVCCAVCFLSVCNVIYKYILCCTFITLRSCYVMFGYVSMPNLTHAYKHVALSLGLFFDAFSCAQCKPTAMCFALIGFLVLIKEGRRTNESNTNMFAEVCSYSFLNIILLCAQAKLFIILMILC